MVIGNYIYSQIEQTSEYSCYFVRQNFTPRKVSHNTSAITQPTPDDPAAGQMKPSVETLSPEQRASLKSKLNNGRGNLSLQEWDDFLADLEEYGIITHDERFIANGTLRDIPEEAQHGGTHAKSGNTSKEIAQMWNGDPLSWLDNMDVYMLKNRLYATMGSRYMYAPGGQREAFHKISQITRNILT